MPSPIASERFPSRAPSKEVTRSRCACFGNRFGMRHRSSQPRLPHQVPLVPCLETRPCVREQLDERSSSLFAVLHQKGQPTLTSFYQPHTRELASSPWIWATPLLLFSAPKLTGARTRQPAVATLGVPLALRFRTTHS